jgi:DNA repair protein RecN (Recombination protein N)
LLERAAALTALRAQTSERLGRAVDEVLPDLGMPDGRFHAALVPLRDVGPEGAEGVEFRVSLNVGHEERPLARVASGGELSRVMLALKTILARLDRVPTLIFDEVDAGIGGRVADVVARKLRTLGSAFQVLCITHLPQIAAHADTHFEIEKRVNDGRTHTTVRRLDERGRVDELARMLGGEAITDGLRRSAREMLMERTKGVRHRGQTATVSDAPTGESERAKGESLNYAKDTKDAKDTKETKGTKETKDTKGRKLRGAQIPD